ncbi:ankyrin-3 [Biomphalaria glabrata]
MFCLNVKAAENVTSWSIQVKPTLLDTRQISYRIIPTKRTFLLTRFPTKQIIADEMSTECFGPPFTKSHTKSFFIQRKISKHCQEIMRLRANRNNLGHYSGKTLICMQHLYKSIADDLWRKRQYTAQEHARSKSRVFPVEGSFLTRTGSKAKCKAVLREKRDCIDKKELPVPAPSDNSPQSHESLHGYSGHECQQFVLNSDEMINEKHPKARMQQTSSAFFFDSYSRQELQVIARTPGALHSAVCEGDMDWMSVLLELGADVNCEYRETTPLMAAATC